MQRIRRAENIVYLAVWLTLFLLPVLSVLYRAIVGRASGHGGTQILSAWLSFLPFLLLFLIHNYLLTPILFKRRNGWLYGILTGCCVALLGLWIFSRQIGPGGARGLQERMEDFRDEEPPWLRDEDDEGPRGGPPEHRDRPEDRPLDPNILRFAIGMLILLANDGLKSYFQTQENEQRMMDLEKANLEQRLQYLRYQINPHFFMNTLNNIHVLVDIDPEKAKISIVELSRLMRYVLYEGNRPTIPLEKEVDFLSHYIGLMRLRFADSVRISFTKPDTAGDVEVPPLMFVTFVENAFKHGISYEEESFIAVSMRTNEGKIIFRCENKMHESNKDPHSGIGLANVRKRLDLLYGTDYTLDISDEDGVYRILVVVPVAAQINYAETNAKNYDTDISYR